MTAPHPAPPDQKTRDPLRVMVVDDDVNDHLLFELAATEARAHLDMAFVSDGVALLDHLEVDLSGPPDLIVLDLRMPRMDGRTVLSKLRASGCGAEIPVLMMSSSVHPEDEVLSIDSGARWYETKPSEFAELVALVESLPHRVAQVRLETKGEVLVP